MPEVAERVPNVLEGIARRDAPPFELDRPDRQRRIVNVTFRVEEETLTFARGRALLSGTSVNALVCRLLEDYSGIHPLPGTEIERRLPSLRRTRVRMSENSYR